MKISFRENDPPTEVGVILELSADEARKLRALVGRMGFDAYNYHKAGQPGGSIFSAAFPNFEADFAPFVTNIWNGLNLHEEIKMPRAARHARTDA